MDWRALAERLYSDFEWSRFRETCESELSGKRVFVAFSGGADSLLVLLLVSDWQRRFGKLTDLRVLHFNHRLRGGESDGDAAFSKSVCESLGLEFVSGIWKNPPLGDSVSEDQARAARMEFFNSVASGATIVSGHHQDDVVETMLMRLSRGSGLAGLSAPRRVSVGSHGLEFVRPILDTRKTEIITALETVGAVWREDASNFGDQFYRNRLRKNVIAAWEEAADRSIAPGVAYSRQLMEEDSAALESCFEQEWLRVWKNGFAKYSDVKALPRGFQRRFFARLAETRECVLSRSSMDIALEAIASGDDVDINLSNTLRLVGKLVLDRIELKESQDADSFSVSLRLGCAVFLPSGARLTAKVVKIDPGLSARILSGAVSDRSEVYLSWSEENGGSVLVRSREAGDAYRPFGKSSPVKLKDLLIDRKIGREYRNALPVVTAIDGTILWVPGLPPNCDLRIDDGTHTALQLTYKG